MTLSHRLTICFSIMQFSYWAMWCSFYSFAGMYLSHYGMSYAVVGITMSAAVLSGIAGQFFWGYLCDRFHTVKKVFLLANAVIWITILLLCANKSAPVLMALMAALGFSLYPQPAILDSWILKKANSHPLNYGFLRMWAALGYAVFVLVIGAAIEAYGFSVIPFFSTFFFAVTAAAALLTPDPNAAESAVSKPAALRGSYKRLLTDRKYVSFLCVCFLIGFGLQTSDNLMPIIVETAGGSPGNLGFVIFASAITEIPFFFLSDKIQRRFSHKTCFNFALCLFVLKFIIITAAFSPAMLAFGMTFQGVGFAIFLPCIRFFAHQNAPRELSTSAQTITDGVTTGLSGAVATLIGGTVIQYLGSRVLLALCLVLALLALLLVNRQDG